MSLLLLFKSAAAPAAALAADVTVSVKAGTAFSDDFNRADGGIGSNYTARVGTFTVFSNAYRISGPSDTACWTEVSTSVAQFSANQSSAFVYTAIVANDEAGPVVRSSATSFYYLPLDGATGSRSIKKYVNGVTTLLGSVNIVPVVGDLVELRAVGSTISAYKNGALVDSVTDTEITSGQPGLYYGRFNIGGTRGDDFFALDLAGVPLSASIRLASSQSASVAASASLSTGINLSTQSLEQFTDGFTGSGSLGAEYTQQGNSPVERLNDRAYSTGTSRAVAWPNQPTFSANQYAEITLTTIGTLSSENSGVMARIQPGAGAQIEQGYIFRTGDNGSYYLIGIYNLASSFIVLATSRVNPQAGHRLRLEAVGSTLTGYVDGTPILSVVNSTYSTGVPGIYGFGGTNWRSDDFAAGSLGPRALVVADTTLSSQIRLSASASIAVSQTSDLTTQASGAALESSASVSATATAALTTQVRLAAGASATVTGTAALTTAIPLASAASVSVVGSAAVSTAIRLAATGAASVTQSAGLSTVILLAGSGAVTATQAGALTTAIPLAGAAALSTTVTASASTAIPLSGAFAASVTSSGALAVGSGLSASAAISVTPSSALTTAIRLSGAISESVVALSAIATAIPLAGTLSAATVATASLGTAIRLAVTGATSVAPSAQISTAIPLLSALSASVSATSALSAQIRLSASASASASTLADLQAGSNLSASASVSVASSALLSAAIRLTGALSSSATASGGVTASIRFASSVASSAAAAGLLSAAIRLAASGSASAAVDSSSLSTAIPLGAALSSSVQAYAPLLALIRLQAAIEASATADVSIVNFGDSPSPFIAVVGAPETDAFVAAVLRTASIPSGSYRASVPAYPKSVSVE